MPPFWVDPTALTAENFNRMVAGGTYDTANLVVCAGKVHGGAGTWENSFGLSGGSFQFTKLAPGKYQLAFPVPFQQPPLIFIQNSPSTLLNPHSYTVQNLTESEVIIHSWVQTGGSPVLSDSEGDILVAGITGNPFWKDKVTSGDLGPDLEASSLNVMVAGGRYDTPYLRIAGGKITISGSLVTFEDSFGLQQRGLIRPDGTCRMYFKGAFRSVPFVMVLAAGTSFLSAQVSGRTTSSADILLLNDAEELQSTGTFYVLAFGD